MSRTQRLITAVYLLAVAYCSTWVPWVFSFGVGSRAMRLGYGWIWVGPEHDWYEKAFAASIDFGAVGLRLVAVSAIWGAAILVASLSPRHAS